MLRFGLVDELDAMFDASPETATPPGAGARRDSAAPEVRDELFVGIRLCVLVSLLENIGWPDALVGPDVLPELLASAPPPEEPEPPPEPDELEDPEELEDDVEVVVRGTA